MLFIVLPIVHLPFLYARVIEVVQGRPAGDGRQSLDLELLLG